MAPELVTFDCAGTLVEVEWTIAGFVLDCARAVGMPIGPEEAREYEYCYARRGPEFLEVNRARDPERGEAFWRRLTQEWLHEVGHDSRWSEPLREAADRLAFGRESNLFRLYDDVVPCLDALAKRGTRLAVISNWDYSLHRVLDMLGIAGRFDLALASLEEGVEKPDPSLYRICLARLGVAPEAALHVGDHPDDDFEGARGAGMRALLLERGARSGRPHAIQSLSEMPEALGWID